MRQFIDCCKIIAAQAKTDTDCDKAGNRIRKTEPEGATLYQFNGKNQLVAEEGSNGKNRLHMTGRAV